MKINFTDAQIQEAASYGFDDKQLTEFVLIGTQARLLNSVAKVAITNPKASYQALNDSEALSRLNPDLMYLEFCLLSMIGKKLTDSEHESVFQKVKGSVLHLVGKNG